MRLQRLLATVVALTLVTSSCGFRPKAIPTLLPVLNGSLTQIFAGSIEHPVLITELKGDERRESVTIDQIPQILQNAVVSIEDERFWEHNGVDPRGVLRAIKSNSSAGGGTQGGSTITQQYVKNALLTPERTFQRKIEEASLALQLEKNYTKEYILEQYLNTIFFGNRSYGVQMASKGYFGHGVDKITLPEAALLAALIQLPAATDPYRNPTAALKRRDLVLEKMASLGYITDAEKTDATATPIQLASAPSDDSIQRYPAPYFVEEVKRFIRSDDHFGKTASERDNLLVNGGLKIYTTLDLDMQAKAEAAVKKHFPNEHRKITDSNKDPDAALVAIDSHNGNVKALVGGYDYFDTDTDTHPYAQVDLAVGGGRQVGSTFKSIALAKALSNGIKMSDVYPAPGSTTVKIPGYAPWTLTGDALGRASLTDCIAHSANTCFANLVADKRVLPSGVTEMATKMGINTGANRVTGQKFQTVPSEVLGANNSTVLEMASAYTTFPNRGIHVPPVMVTKVVKADGTVIYQHEYTQTKVIEPEAADEITKGLQAVMTRGTAAGITIGRPAAGKTGTTQSFTDAWFIGFTPDLTTAVWTGYAQTIPPGTRGCPSSQRDTGCLRQVGSTGATVAAPVWETFMKDALANVPPSDFDFSRVATTGAPTTTTTTTVKPGNTDILQKVVAPEDTTMPTLTGGSINDAASKARRAGLTLRRIDVQDPSSRAGQVLGQSPAPGSSVRKGATITVEATPGTPPPSSPLPDTLGQGTGVVAQLQSRGYIVSTVTEAAPPGFILSATGLPPASGQIWQSDPVSGSIPPDGRVTLRVQP